MRILSSASSQRGALVAVLVAMGWLVGCGGGGSDSTSNLPPTSDGESVRLDGVAMSDSIAGDTDIEVQLRGEALTDVSIRYSIDGGLSWQEATIDGETQVQASPDGSRHRWNWDALQDLGIRHGQVTVSVEANGEEITLDSEYRNSRQAADQIEAYLIHFGPMDDDKVSIAEKHDLVILSPCHESVTRDVIAEIQDGVDPEDPGDDCLVLAYVNAGEDPRTIGVSDEDLDDDLRFVGDGLGPRVDPRGPFADGLALEEIDPLGLPSGSGGFASYYLDDVSVDRFGIGDGLPDRHPGTDACFVNMGAPLWFETLDIMQCEKDGYPGFQELLTENVGIGFAFDGVYLDNVDTCAPNAWTSSADPVQAEFEWTAPGYAEFLAKLRVQYPEKLIMQNRGLFFFHPGLPHYAVANHEALDFLGFESYRLDADPRRQFDPVFFQDNKFNFAPKIQAEANRPDGFQVLSLGYASGPGIVPDTLLGTQQVGFDTLLRDAIESQNVVGFRHYIHDAGGQVLNDFVRSHASFEDDEAPAWTSTYNPNNPPFTRLPEAPPPRIGIQEVIAGTQSVTLRWDVALDLNPVRYVIYYDDRPLDFDDDDFLDDVQRIEAVPRISDEYRFGSGPSVYPYEYIVDGLRENRRYSFAVRAIDSHGNEDTNERQLRIRTLRESRQIKIDGWFLDWFGIERLHRDRRDARAQGGPDWRNILVHNDAENLFIYFDSQHRFNLDGSPSFESSQVFIYLDVDDNPFTGLSKGSLGAELVIEGSALRDATAPPDSPPLAEIDIARTTNTWACELAVPIEFLDRYAGFSSRVRLIFWNPGAPDLAPDEGHLEFELIR